MAQLEALGADTAAIRRALRSRDCNSLTATYHLQLEAHLEAQRAAAAREREAAAERAAAAKRAAEQRGASSASDWQWDFAAISAHAAQRGQPASGAASAAGAPSSPTAAGSSTSSSLRGSGSPARLRLAAAPPAGSPTRFGVEAAAAGYVASPRRPATSGAATPTLHFGGTPFSSPPPALQPPAAQQPDGAPPASGEAWPQPGGSEPFTIKALHAPAGGSDQSVSTPVAAAAAAAELAAAAALIASSAVATTTAVVEAAGPTSPSKSPRLSPVPGRRPAAPETLCGAWLLPFALSAAGSTLGCAHRFCCCLPTPVQPCCLPSRWQRWAPPAPRAPGSAARPWRRRCDAACPTGLRRQRCSAGSAAAAGRPVS